MPQTQSALNVRPLRFASRSRQQNVRRPIRRTLARRSIAFGDTPEESDTLSWAEWEALAKVLAHEIAFGKHRPGVKVHRSARARVPVDPSLVRHSQEWCLSQSCFRRLQHDWMLARLVMIPTELGEAEEFAVEPTELAKLALRHTKPLRDRVCELVIECWRMRSEP
jgi:hypothetical protein